MFKNHLPSFTILFLLVSFLFFMEACNYKNAKHFSPTDPNSKTTLSIPQLIHPPNGATGLDRDLTFEWQMLDQASAYDFQIIKEGESFQNANSFSQSGLSSNMYQVEGLDFLTNYQWRVRATAGDLKSDWSSTWEFTTKEEPPSFHELTITKEGEGSVSSTPTGINCGDDCSEEYEEGTEVTLIAEAAEGWLFDGWSGDVPDSCNDKSESCTIVMDAVKTVKATFVEEEDPFETFIFEDLLVCIEHSATESDIYWLFKAEEFPGSELMITMKVTRPDGTEEEVTLSSYSQAGGLVLFHLDIFVVGEYDWEITSVKIDGEEVPFDGLTSGTVNVTGSEENAGQCTTD